MKGKKGDRIPSRDRTGTESEAGRELAGEKGLAIKRRKLTYTWPVRSSSDKERKEHTRIQNNGSS